MIILDPDLDLPSTAIASRGKAARPPKGFAEHGDSFKQKLPSARSLERFLNEASAAIRLHGQVSVLLTNDATMRRLNRRFRGKNKTTDVLSFPSGEEVKAEIAGDLAVSVPTARRQAAERGHSLSAEIKLLMLHGLLHLLGFDHETDEGQMFRRERTLRAKLGLPQGLIERAGGAAGRPLKSKSPQRRSAQRATRSSRL